MRIIDISQIRTSIRTFLGDIAMDADVTVIVQPDAAPIAVMPYECYSSLIETIHLLSSPNNAAHLARSIAQADSRSTRQSRKLIEC